LEIGIVDINDARGSVKEDLNSTLIICLEKLGEAHHNTHEDLCLHTNHELFPAHILYLAVLGRSLEQLEGFLLLFKEKQYGNCIALLRMQMDSIMRFFGVLNAEDMHDIANRLANGDQLRNLEDKDGKKMRDGYLHKLLDKINPGFSHDYDYACGFVHFSQEHFLQLLNRSWGEERTEISLRLGSDYELMGESDATILLASFYKYTNGILGLNELLEEKSKNYDVAELKLRYQSLQ